MDGAILNIGHCLSPCTHEKQVSIIPQYDRGETATEGKGESQSPERSEIITLKRLGVETIQSRLDTLRNELERIPGVEAVSFSSLVPYEQSSSGGRVTTEMGNEDLKFVLNVVIVDENFLPTYDIPLLAGRNLSVNIVSTEHAGLYAHGFFGYTLFIDVY